MEAIRIREYNNALFNKYIDAIGFTPFHRRLFWKCGLAWSVDNMSIVLNQILIFNLARTWNIGEETQGILGTCNMLGLFIGAFILGSLGDKVGRKKIFSTSQAVVFLGTALAVFSSGVFMMAIGLLLNGIGLGGLTPIMGSFFAEFMPNNKRHLLSLMTQFWVVGASFIAATAYFIGSSDVLGMYNWRFIALTAAIVDGLSFAVTYSLPESPKFDLLNGREEEAAKTLTMISQESETFHQEPFVTEIEVNTVSDAPLAGKIQFKSAGKEAVHPKANPAFSRWTELYSRRFLYITLTIQLAMGISTFGYRGFTTFTSQIYKANNGEMSYQENMLNVLVTQLCGSPGILLGTYLIQTDRFGRKWTVAGAFLLCGLAIWMFTWVHDSLGMVIASSCFMMCANAAYAAAYTIKSESYPTNIRATAFGFLYCGSNLCGSIGPYVAGYLLELDDLNLALLILSSSMIISAIVSGYLRETRGRVFH